MDNLEIVCWPIEKLIPYARNPRINNMAVPKVASAIKEFGFKVPVVARSDGEIIDGHLRIKAAELLGLTEIPVVLADDLTPQQVKAFRISVNRMADLADWDEKLLALELEEIDEELLPAIGWDEDFANIVNNPVSQDIEIHQELDTVDDLASNLKNNSRKSILIDFNLEDYQEALRLISEAKKVNLYVGAIFVEALKYEID